MPTRVVTIRFAADDEDEQRDALELTEWLKENDFTFSDQLES